VTGFKATLKYSVSFRRIAVSFGLKGFYVIFNLPKHILFKLLFSEILCPVLCIYNPTYCLLQHIEIFLSCSLLYVAVKIIYAKNTKPKQLY